MKPRAIFNRRVALVLTGATLLMAPDLARGQEARTTQGGEDDPTGVTTASGVVVPELSTLRPGRAALLREGSHLVEVTGVMKPDELTGEWRFHISRDDPSAPGYVLTMLPSTLLGEMIAIVKSSPDTEVVFETTGEVFVYRTRNYLLPTHPPRLVRHSSDASPTTAPDAPAEPASEGSDESEDSVEDIMRKLDEAVDTVAPPAHADDSRLARSAEGDDEAQSQDLGVGPGRSENLLREGTAILSRRGQVRRDSGGAWVFVFDADASGLADPPLTLLPCLLLERIETQVRKRGDTAPVLLSGHIYVFEGRNYIMPSVYRVSREHTVLSPR